MSSGVTVRKDVTDLFHGVKMGTVNQNVIVMKVEDEKEIVVDTDYSGTPDWKAFVETLPEDDVRYVIFDFPYEPLNRKIDKKQLIFLHWCPENVSVKTKLLYASSMNAVKSVMGGDECPMFMAECKEECVESVILEKLNKLK